MNNKVQNQRSDYLLRNIPAELKKKAQHRAIEEGLSLRDVILKAIKLYLDGCA